MLPIYISYDNGLDAIERTAIREAVLEFQRIFPERKFYNFGSKAWSDGDFSSGDWYVNHARRVMRKNFPLQLDAGSILHLFEREPWQNLEEHIDVFFTSHDLTARFGFQWLNFCFGLTRGHNTVQSVSRFRRLAFRNRKLAVKAVLLHELGRVLGAAADPGRHCTEENLGRHCTNYGCIMRQGLTVEEWVEHAMQAESRGWYCTDCRNDIRRSRI